MHARHACVIPIRSVYGAIRSCFCCCIALLWGQEPQVNVCFQPGAIPYAIIRATSLVTLNQLPTCRLRTCQWHLLLYLAACITQQRLHPATRASLLTLAPASLGGTALSQMCPSAAAGAPLWLPESNALALSFWGGELLRCECYNTCR